MSASSPLLLTGGAPPGRTVRPARAASAGRLRRVLVVIVTGCAAIAWLFLFRPLGLGGRTGYVVVAGTSMEPTYRTGDLVLTRSAPTYGVGDIVAFRIPDDGTGRRPVVIHRIVGGDATDGYVLQGDNTGHRDLWRPGPHDVLGAAWLHLPHGGLALAIPRSPLGLASLTAVFVFLAVMEVPSAGKRPR